MISDKLHSEFMRAIGQHVWDCMTEYKDDAEGMARQRKELIRYMVSAVGKERDMNDCPPLVTDPNLPAVEKSRGKCTPPEPLFELDIFPRLVTNRFERRGK